MNRQGPVFLGGVDRSGIGLVGDLLDQHPAFAISRRTNFWAFFDGRFGDLDDTANLHRCLDAMMRSRRFLNLGLDRGRLATDLASAKDRSYPYLFALVGEQHARQRGKGRWGDKSLGAERHAARILESYPYARMIHVVRDPRDRHVSVKTHRQRRRGGIVGTSSEWRQSAKAALRNRDQFGDRYLVVRYEDLVDDVDETMSLICRFLDEQVAPQVLSVRRDPEGSSEPIHQRSVGRYHRELGKLQTAVVESVLRREMSEFGYFPHSGSGRIERVLIRFCAPPMRLAMLLAEIRVRWLRSTRTASLRRMIRVVR